MKSANQFLIVSITLKWLIGVAITFVSTSGFAEVRFSCTQSNPVIFGCYFRIKEIVGIQPALDFVLLDQQTKVLGDEFLNRRYCFDLYTVHPAPGSTPSDQQRDHDSICSFIDNLIQEANTNKRTLDPIPAGKIWFFCTGGMVPFVHKPCNFSFERNDTQKNITIESGEEIILDAKLIGSNYCTSLGAQPENRTMSYSACVSKFTKSVVRLRNDDSGRDYAVGVSAEDESVGFIPLHILKNPSLVAQCVLYGVPPPGSDFFMIGYFVNTNKKMVGTFTGIPSALDALRMDSMCKGKWLSQIGEGSLTKLADFKLPTQEELQKKIEFGLRQMAVLQNGYVLHVRIQSMWYALYQELYYEAKVTTTDDPNSAEVVVDELKFFWRHGQTGKTVNCGKTSVCSQSDRIYATSVFGPGEVCMSAASSLAGLVIGTVLPKGKPC